jgi:hypothetical protein
VGKPDSPIWHFRDSGFDSSRVASRKEATQENLKIQVCLKHGKGNRSIKEPKQKRLEPKDEAVKTRPSGFEYRTIQFF